MSNTAEYSSQLVKDENGVTLGFWDDPVRYHREYYARRRQEYLDYLGGGPCAKCGSPDNLEFDHVDPELKSFNIVVTSPMTDEVKAELDKCQLLCHECHKAKTAEQHRERILAKGFTHGTMYGWLRKKCTCGECETAKRAYYDKRNAERRKQSAELGTGRREPQGRPSTHGERLHYHRGRRCRKCRAVNAAAERERLARLRNT